MKRLKLILSFISFFCLTNLVNARPTQPIDSDPYCEDQALSLAENIFVRECHKPYTDHPCSISEVTIHRKTHKITYQLECLLQLSKNDDLFLNGSADFDLSNCKLINNEFSHCQSSH